MYVKWLFCASLFVLIEYRPVKGEPSLDQLEKLAKSVRNSCLQKIDTTEERVFGLRRGEFPDDYNLACYTNCIMKALRTYKNDAIDFKMLLKQVDSFMPAEVAPRLKAGIRKCAQEEYASDGCEMCYQYVQCCYHSDPEIFFFP